MDVNIFQNKDYLDDLTVRMAHHNTGLEGNTLSQDETASIILNGIIPKATSEREYFEVKNYKTLVPFLIKSAQDKI
jgi:Fic family protein